MGVCHPNIISRRDAVWLSLVIRAKTDQGDLRSNRLRRILAQLEEQHEAVGKQEKSVKGIFDCECPAFQGRTAHMPNCKLEVKRAD